MNFAKRTQEVIENKGSALFLNPRKPKKTQANPSPASDANSPGHNFREYSPTAPMPLTT
jgi:hypothetical protein